MDDELLQTKGLLQVVLRSISDSVIILDVNGNITNLNAAAELLTGWNLGEVSGLPIHSMIQIINETTKQEINFSLFEISRFDLKYQHEWPGKFPTSPVMFFLPGF